MAMNLKCSKCGAENADRHTLVGSVIADLCPKCRTLLHTFISSETKVTEFWERQIERTIAQHDPLLFKVANANFLDIELEMHKAVKEWVYGPDTNNTQ